MKVKLKCQMDNGKTILPPETETEMSRDEAMKLADMGLVEIIPDEAPAKPVQASTATKPVGRPKKEKAAEPKTKKAPAANPKDEGGSAAEDADNDSDGVDDEGQDADNDSGDSDDGISDPDSLVE